MAAIVLSGSARGWARLGAAALLVAGLAACGTAKEDRTMGGTAVGAAMGAAVGGAFGGIGAGPGALLGGIAGATTGAFTEAETVDFGQPLWKQYRRAGGTLPARETNRGLVVTMNALLFEFDSDQMRPEGSEEIGLLADFMRESEDLNVIIEGHADATGDSEYNMDLSKRRAESVAAELRDMGVAGERISTEGFGEDQPVASNDTAEGRQQNRRVEMVLQ